MIHINQYKLVRKCLVFFLLTSVIYIAACKKSDQPEGGKGAPVITSLRAISPKPNDSTLTIASPGQFVVIRGSNLASTKEIYFNGWPASFNSAIFSDNDLVVLIPAEMPFGLLNKEDLNKVRVVTAYGETTFNIPISPPAPTINTMSYESAVAGTVVTIYGNNFFFIDKVVFPGEVSVTENLKTNDSGTTLTITVPAGVTSVGPIKVINSYGEGVSVFRFNDLVTGMFTNFDNINKFQYWSASQSGDAGLFPGAIGNYAHMKFGNISAKNTAWYDSGRSINLDAGVWIPAGNLSDPTDSWALKFDISVKEPWATGALLIRTDSYEYMARYEPWKETGKPFTSTGWITVTMPFSSFKNASDDTQGTGTSIGTLGILLGTNGSKVMTFMFYNESEIAVEKFEAAVDNIRIVKIK